MVEHYGAHMAHCFQGECEGYCKYGDDADCPARPQEVKLTPRGLPFPAPHERSCATCPYAVKIAAALVPTYGVPQPAPQLHAHPTGNGVALSVTQPPGPAPSPDAEVVLCTFTPQPRGLVPAIWGCQFHPNA